MRYRPSPIRLFILLVTLTTLALATDAWSQDQSKKKKGGSKEVTKVIKNVDRQLLSFSPEKARQLLKPVMEEKDPRVDAAMGQVLVLEQEFDEGIAKLDAASKKTDDPVILLALGDAQTAARDRGSASSSFKRTAKEAAALLANNPTDTDARFALGTAQQRLGQYDDAIANLTKAKTDDARNPRIPFELGMTKMSQGNNQAAFDELSRAIELYSGYAYAYYYRALAASKIDRKDITVNDLDRFLALAPNAPEAAKAQRILQAARG